VGVAEGRSWGGTCVNAGCVPKKLLVQGGEYGASAEDATSFGWDIVKVRNIIPFGWSLFLIRIPLTNVCSVVSTGQN